MIPVRLLATVLFAATASKAVCLPTPPGTVKCPIVFDGRVPMDFEPSGFDDAGRSPFNTGYVKGNGLLWSEILKFPDVEEVGRSRFENGRPVTVTLGDESVFQTQRGFRRAGLLFKDDVNEGGEGSRGARTMHWSIKIDAGRALNLSHEYLNVWHETADYAASQFNFEMGTIIGQEELPRDTFKIMNRQNRPIWSGVVDEVAWNNFAVTIDYEKNTLQVYYSKNNEPLTSVAGPLENDNSGKGQYQMGLLKKPTGTSDVVNSGYQASGINEGLVYGGIFLEDSADGCVSL